MKSADSYWVAKEIHRWRGEVGVEKKCNPEKLRSTLQRIKEPSSRGLVLFTVLSSEWLFRVKKIGKTEVDLVLGEVERGLRRILRHNLSDLVTASLAPYTEAGITKEGRIHFPLSPFCAEAPELLHYPLWEPERREYHPQHRLKMHPGPLVWPAPWIAALTAARL